MLNNELRPYLVENFTKTYKNYLTKIYGDKTFENMLRDRKVRKAFYNVVKEYFNTMYEYYDRYPQGNLDNELKYIESSAKLKSLNDEYVALSHGDKTLFGYLKMYGYSVEQMNQDAVDKYGHLDQKRIDKLFEIVNVINDKNYETVKMDMDANNYWWLKDTATTLRRQLGLDYVMISEKRLQAMFDKYFPRKFEASKITEVDNVELMKELDFAMNQKYHTLPYYFWWGEGANGEKKLLMAPQPPQNGKYTFVVYQNYTSDEVAKDKKEYYL